MTSGRLPEELIQRLRAKKQGHVLKFYEAGNLQPHQVDALRQELESLDLDHIESIFNASTSAVKVDDQDQIKDQLEPLEEFDRLEECSNAKIQKWRSKGLEAIRKGQVCALVLSGGQGTRLGFSGPKGMYSIGLPSHKSLFQLFAERIRKLEQLAGHGSKIHFYLMTSKMNHEETVSFFEQHDYFGLKESQMFFFPQGTLPCFTLEGKLMLQNSYQLATASDGNGGIYHALSKSGALTKLQKQHVKYLHVFSVDNALCKVADPVFIGYCIDKNADCANKVVWKSRPDESVGVVAKKNGKFCIIEYSEMDSDIRKQTDPKTGQLAYGAANICNHFFTTEFLADVVIPKMSLEYHVAKKKIPMADENGKTFTPSSNSGIKLEAFIFDTFPLSSRMAVLSVPRENEFAPVKNAPGAPVDSPDSACKMLEEEAHLWLRNSVFKEADDNLKAELKALKYLEISPLVSYNGEGLTLDTVKTNFVTGSNVLRLESNAFKSHRGSIPSALRSRFEKANQEHVFKFIDQGNVTAQEAARLIERLSDLDLQALKTIFDRSTGVSDPPATSLQSMLHSIEPLGDKVVDVLRDTPETVKKDWYHKGVEAISKGQVAALVLGGGQGTRLGFAGPKGMYDIGLPSGTSLFEMFALRVRKAQLLAKNKFPNGKNLIPFIVMTSEMNHEETRSFFQQHSFFGLSPNQVQFFMQGTLPCFTNDGKLILEAPAVLSRASDGNGGIYAALKKSGVLSDLEKKAVQYVHVFSVDNALCKVADPVFVGYCIDQEADCGNKVVWKERPDESVGVFAKRNGEGFAVVEYSEIDKISTELIDPTSGRLLFGAANICNHLYCIDFLKDCCELGVFAEYHVAKKKIPFVNDQGETVVPKENSGIKLETFIFDVFQRATNIKVLVVERQDEFAPVKNAPGASTDSPDTARHLISEQCKRWLLDVNATFDDMTNGLCEVSPLISYNGEGLEEFARKKSPLKLPCVLK